jgi:hypothetical protein
MFRASIQSIHKARPLDLPPRLSKPLNFRYAVAGSHEHPTAKCGERERTEDQIMALPSAMKIEIDGHEVAREETEDRIVTPLFWEGSCHDLGVVATADGSYLSVPYRVLLSPSQVGEIPEICDLHLLPSELSAAKDATFLVNLDSPAFFEC